MAIAKERQWNEWEIHQEQADGHWCIYRSLMNYENGEVIILGQIETDRKNNPGEKFRILKRTVIEEILDD